MRRVAGWDNGLGGDSMLSYVFYNPGGGSVRLRA